MSDMPLRNVQLSTFNGVTERAHGGRDMGTDTKFEIIDAIVRLRLCRAERIGAQVGISFGQQSGH